MMQAFVSGQAARVGLIEGEHYSYFELARPEVIADVAATDFAALFNGASDVESLSVRDPKQTYDLARKKFNLDRGLMLLDIALNETDVPISIEAATEFMRIMQSDAEAASSIRNYVFASPNSELPSEEVLCEFAEISLDFAAFVDEVKRSQVNIMRFDAALRKAIESLDIQAEIANDFYCHAVEYGAFHDLVTAANSNDNFGGVVLSLYARLAKVREARRIVQSWTQNFIDRSTRTRLRHLEEENEEVEDSLIDPDRPTYEVFQSVIKQQSSIVERLRARDWATARKYAEALVRQQVNDGHDLFAAKSMSRLAIEARHMGQGSLELEWARRAVELAPDDGKARGILADTYLLLYRLPEAQAAFEETARLGNDQFGESGVGRVARVAGRLEDALAIFRGLIEKYGENTEPELWTSLAETLRELGKYQEALEIYEAGIERHSDSVYLHCGRAAVLADLGQWPESRQLYEYAVYRWPADPGPLCGLGETYKIEGQFENSLEVFDNAINLFPQSVIAACGRAEVFRAWGRIDEARSTYDQVVQLFPHDPAPLAGLAEALKDQRRFDHAIEILTAGNEKFPTNPRLRNALANVVKLSGDFAEALRLYDENVKDFPQNIYSLTGRANLLRLLGNYDAALEVYDRIIAQSPKDKFSWNSKAAIFIAREQYSEAEAILSGTPLNTEMDWSALHLSGLLDVRRQNLESARILLSKGMACPFFRVKNQFVTTLAFLDLLEGKTEDALLQVSTHQDAISQVLSAHALVHLGQFDVALTALTAVNDNNPPTVVGLRQSIWRAAMNPDERIDDERLHRNEIEAILQAA